LNIFNAKNLVDGHVKKSIIRRFSTESHFTWQLDVGFIKQSRKFHIKIPNGC